MRLRRRLVVVCSALTIGALLAGCDSDSVTDAAGPNPSPSPSPSTSSTFAVPAAGCLRHQPSPSKLAPTLAQGTPVSITACLYDFEQAAADGPGNGALVGTRALDVDEVMTALAASQKRGHQTWTCTTDLGQPGALTLTYADGSRRHVVLTRGGCGFIQQSEEGVDWLLLEEANGPWFEVSTSIAPARAVTKACPDSEPQSRPLAPTLALGTPRSVTACHYGLVRDEEDSGWFHARIADARELDVAEVMTALRAAQPRGEGDEKCDADTEMPGVLALRYDDGRLRHVVVHRGACYVIDQNTPGLDDLVLTEKVAWFKGLVA